MTEKLKLWMKPIMTLVLLALLARLLPLAPLDPWNLLSPKKVATMIFALAAVQALGSALNQYLGPRTGALLTGFLGGLVSSTATTAALARRSAIDLPAKYPGEMLSFLAATAAMLTEGLILVVIGSGQIHFSTLVIFFGPILATVGLIYTHARSLQINGAVTESSRFEILPLLKLSIFIVAILAISKISQNLFGQNGLLILTGLVSLFEIHGSVIANVQLHEAGAVSVHQLSGLLAVSVVAAYLSKLFLIATLGSREFRAAALRSMGLLAGALAASWAASIYLL